MKTWDDFKYSWWSWFRNESKYSKKELIINWIIAVNIGLMLVLEIIMFSIYGYRFIQGLKGLYPIYLWCPVWASVVFSLQFVIEIIALTEKFRERRRRIKYSKIDRSTSGPVPKSKKYTTESEKSGHRKTFD